MPEPLSTSTAPIYTLSQKKSRLLIPQLLTFLFLGLIFYLGILLNISLLKLTASQETNIKLVSLIILILLIILGIIFAFRKARQEYHFYSDKIIFQKKPLLLKEITTFTPKQNLLDRFFKTYSLILNPKFKLANISLENSPQELQDYLQKLIAYARQFN